MLSGDLDEYAIQELVREGAPVDAFGVGTQLAASADAPGMGTIYKMVELDISGIKRFTAKLSEDKSTLPGAKQIFRFEDHDVLARSGECSKGKALLRPVLLGGQMVETAGRFECDSRLRRGMLRALSPELRKLEVGDPYDVRLSKELKELVSGRGRT